MSAYETLAVLLPALVANGSATLVARGTPIDFRRVLPDGRRILGDGKTIEGTLIALLYGWAVSLLLYNLGLAPLTPLSATPVGAVLGDMAGSFIKRRLGVERGEPLPILDQLDFYVGAVAAVVASGYMPDPLATILFAAATLVLHRATNIAAYKLGVKTVPW